MDRYNKLNTFLKNKFGERTLKICIDGGFTCPNRDGKCGFGGCVFCGERGSGEHMERMPIKKQVENFINSYRGKRANKYIAYFQNFTNTYDSVENLKKKYDEALINDKIVALAIATRPDCISTEIVDLIRSYIDKGIYVWVELGLQTVNENVGKIINRGYTNDDFINAVEMLTKAKIDVVTHLMIGLPNEEENDIYKTLEFINKSPVKGLKIHSTYVIKDTALEKLYLSKQYTPIDMTDYIEKVIFILTHLRRDIIVHRVTGDAPRNLLIAPEFCGRKKWVMNRIENIMDSDNLTQGMFYNS